MKPQLVGLLLCCLAGGLLSPASFASRPPALSCSELTLYSREGCPHCGDARHWLDELQDSYPELLVEVRDIGGSAEARADFRALNRSRRIRQPGVPTFAFCGEVLVGFDSPATTGALIERVLLGQASLPEQLVVELPVFGEISPGGLGLPLFTVVLGLVDGFNPCAMWVLLFLLSLLVHVRTRARILLVAGTFVLVSGLIYFAFMAAWLNVYLLLGFSRGLQLALGLVAVLIGTIHVKDFFRFRQGVSLSIPEGVKPTIYQRASRVVRAENLIAAVLGVAAIAVLVNFVELLCTAGLPALYTQVLTWYPLEPGAYYGYLLLYNLAYIFDDALMVAIAVLTLGQYRLQERGGRWLKLLSGLVILCLGVLLVLAPGSLVF